MKNIEDKILEILMRYQNPIPVGMDTSKGSIELDHNETVKHLSKLFQEAMEEKYQEGLNDSEDEAD